MYKSSTFIFFLTVNPMSDSTFSMVVGWYLCHLRLRCKVLHIEKLDLVCSVEM